MPFFHPSKNSLSVCNEHANGVRSILLTFPFDSQIKELNREGQDTQAADKPTRVG